MEPNPKKSTLKIFLWSVIAIGFGVAFSGLVVHAVSNVEISRSESAPGEGLGSKIIAYIENFTIRAANGAANAANNLNFDSITLAPEKTYHLKDKNLLPHTGALAYVVGDADTGEIIIEKNSDTVSPIASVTKLMTALTSLENLDQSDITKVSRRAAETLGHSGLSTGENIKISDLLYPLLLVSSNDSSEVLAEHAGRERFLELMNKDAKAIGMTNTNYNDPSGLSSKNYSTAKDLFVMTHYLFTKHKTVFNITNLDRFSVGGRTWANANHYSGRSDYLGGKTGYTDAAHRTGVALFSATLSDGQKRNIAITLLKTDDRTADINRILDYIEANVYFSYEDENAVKNTSEVTLGFVGDIMLDRGVKTSVIKNFGGDYNKIFAEAEALAEPDIMFGNLEGPISDKGNKVGSIYSFRMDPLATDALKSAGFDILSFANNHVGDYSDAAFLDTLGRLEEADILFTGAGEDYEQASRPTIIERDGIRIAYLAVSDVGPEFMKATDVKPGILLANDKNLDTIIKNAKALSDVLVVSIHWGDEYKPHNNRQATLAKRMIDNGADIVAGHHPHVPQDTLVYKDGLIIYSLGNFVFDQSFSKDTMGGLYSEVTITKEGIKSHKETPFRINEKYQPILGGTSEELVTTLPYERGSCPVGNSDSNEMFTNVSAEHSIDKYVPETLVEINESIPTKESRDLCLVEKAAAELEKMINDAKGDNIDIAVTSAFRSFDTQTILYANRKTDVATESIAIPGHSEHQLGTTVDLTTSEVDNDSASAMFKSTEAYKWLGENAHKYGFIMSYPAGRDTGYIFEPWHWRYLGTEHAKEIKTKNLTIQEYLEKL